MKYEWVVRVGIGSIPHGSMAWDERAELAFPPTADLAKRAADAAIEYAVKNLKRTETRALLSGRGMRTAFTARVVARPVAQVFTLDQVIDVISGPWEETCDDIGVAIHCAKAAALVGLAVVIGADGN